MTGAGVSGPNTLEKVARAIYTEGAWCGTCEYEGWLTCAECRRVAYGHARVAFRVMADEFLDAIVSAGRACEVVAESLRREAENIGLNDPASADFLYDQADQLDPGQPGAGNVVSP